MIYNLAHGPKRAVRLCIINAHQNLSMSKKHILIIEDEKRIAHWLITYFERAGFTAEAAHDGPLGLSLAQTSAPDLIVLDLMLPGMNGMEICHRLRRSSDVPIIMLTAKGTQPDRIDGLESGADDYIVKPFDPEEVVARANAVLRRATGKVTQQLLCGAIALDEKAQTVLVKGIPINVSQAQFAILSTFMRHPNQILSRDQLISLAFNNDFDGFDRAIDTHIRRLRKLIHVDDQEPIQTVYGAGYKFVVEEA
ncbi:MAG: response regulator transcription factor [Anaerolineae bacterium]